MSNKTILERIIDDKQSEINKLRELVIGLNKDLGMGKLLVTADAIHSQKKLSRPT